MKLTFEPDGYGDYQVSDKYGRIGKLFVNSKGNRYAFYHIRAGHIQFISNRMDFKEDLITALKRTVNLP